MATLPHHTLKILAVSHMRLLKLWRGYLNCGEPAWFLLGDMAYIACMVVLYIGIMKVWGFWPEIITPKPA